MQGDRVDDDLVDNIGGQRSKIDVMATILHICAEGSLKNHIIGRGNFSDSMANHYLSILLYHNLLESSKDENSRTYYRTTQKGRALIQHYNSIQQLFGKESLLSTTNGSHEKRSDEITNKPLISKHILIVDDEPDISSAIKVGLEDHGFRVSVFDDPLAALSNYKSDVYDLLIIDVKMPKMSGFELYREVRKVDNNVGVCFLTAFEMYYEEFKRVFPSMDVKHFIQKPIAMSDLVDKIKKLTGITASV